MGGAALEVRAKLDAVILALLGGRQKHKLGIGEFHRDFLRSVGDGISRRHRRSPALAMTPSGQNPATRPCSLVEPSHTTALLPPNCQSFLDNLIAGFGPTRSSNDPEPQGDQPGRGVKPPSAEDSYCGNPMLLSCSAHE